MANEDLCFAIYGRKTDVDLALKNNEHINHAVAVGMQNHICGKRLLLPIASQLHDHLFSQFWEGQFPAEICSKRSEKGVRDRSGCATEVDLLIGVFHTEDLMCK